MFPTRRKRIYDGCRIEAPDGTLMCLVAEKKARWYLARDLAVVVGEDPLTIRLKFEPEGLGHAGDPFYTERRLNRCVVCGEEEGLTHHHVVPRCYRRHFPAEYKSHSSHDLVPLCVDCHARYEIAAAEYKTGLALRHDAPLEGTGITYDPALARVRKAAGGLHRHVVARSHVLPPERVAELRRVLAEHFGAGEVEEDLIRRGVEIEPQTPGPDFRDHGQLVVEAAGDLDAFARSWREHFVRTLEPRFLPPHWRTARELGT